MSAPVSERPYLSIGEVLGLLLEEFPDVTISKIRFLESQGLIDPERTPSGYRKFYDGDVERLRMILREQRENFLPLKVIRDRLESGAIDREGAVTPPRGIRNVTVLGDDGHHPTDDTPSRQHPSTQLRLAADLSSDDADDASSPAAIEVAAASSPPKAIAHAAPPAPPASVTPVARHKRQLRSFSALELCAAAGITDEQLAELEAFGLLDGRGNPANPVYASTDVEIARAAGGFMDRGVEARHLRTWRQAAEREASLFEQMILPALRQRNPQARQQAIARLHDLAQLGGELRAAMIDAALAPHTEGHTPTR